MLGRRLTELRKEKKLTQTEIAEKLHMSRSTYAQYEVDRRVPEYATLEKIADFFDVSIDYVVGRTNERNRTLQPHSRKLIDLLDQNLSNEDIYQAFNEKFLVGGIPVSREEALFFIQYLRTKRTMEKTQDSVSRR